jgi:hypothetical protein
MYNSDFEMLQEHGQVSETIKCPDVKNSDGKLADLIDRNAMTRCSNCETDFVTYDEFERHFTDDNPNECNILLEELRLIEVDEL